MSGMQELVKTVLGQIDIYFLMIRLLVPLVAKDLRYNAEAIFTFQQTSVLMNKQRVIFLVHFTPPQRTITICKHKENKIK